MKRSIKTLIVGLMAAAVISLAVTPCPAKTWKMTVASGYPPVFVFISAIHDYFIPYVDEKLAPLGHKIEWREAYGGTVVKIGSELEAVKTGIVEMTSFATLFEPAKMPLHSVTYFIPFGTDDMNMAIEVMDELQNSIPEVADEWTRNNMVYLGGSALDTYHIFSNYPVRSVDDLSGHKFAAPGPVANWFKGTGGVAVNSSLPEYYNSIQLGVFDGVACFTSGAMGIKLFEVAPYVAEVNIGAQYAGGLAINKKLYDSMPAEVQKILQDAGKIYAKKFAEVQAAKVKGATIAMEKAGATFIPFSGEKRAEFARKLPNVPMDWAESMEAKGLPGKKVVKAYLDGLRKRGVKLVREWDKE
jgi:TRAP-type C4-dicarboxylate transport system substrate-binding protein